MKTARIIYAGSEGCADLLYLTGFLAEDPFLYLETGEERFLVVSSMEVERARRQARQGVLPLTYWDAAVLWHSTGKSPRSVESLVSAFTRHYGVREWLVPFDFPYGLATRLAARLKGRAALRTARGLFCPGRAVKSRAEIEAVRHAQGLAERGLSRALDILAEASVGKDGILLWRREKLTAEILKAEINISISSAGGLAKGTIAAPGAQAACPHNTGTGPIHANIPVVLDIFPRCEATGYFGDLTRTVVKGRASKTAKAAFLAVRDAQKMVLDTLRPGVTGCAIQRMVEEFFRKRGYRTDLFAESPFGFIHSVGHGVGLEIHEMPTLSSRGEEPLEEGNVVSDEPGLYYPEWGGVRIEDTVALTSDGCENLSTAPVELEIP